MIWTAKNGWRTQIILQIRLRFIDLGLETDPYESFLIIAGKYVSQTRFAITIRLREFDSVDSIVKITTAD